MITGDLFIDLIIIISGVIIMFFLWRSLQKGERKHKKDLLMEAEAKTYERIKSGDFHNDCLGEGCIDCSWSGKRK